MGTTSNRSYPYPAGSDAVDVPGDIQALADDVDADVAAVIAGTGLADGAVTTAKIADGAVTFAKTSGVAPATALRLPGTSGNYVSTPDSAALDITGDIEIIVKIAADDWTSGSTQIVLAKRKNLVTTGASYWCDVTGTGAFRFSWRDTGTSTYRELSSSTLGLVDGTSKWLRVKFDADTGSGCSAEFSSSDDGSTWSVVNTATDGTAAAIQTTDSPVELGSQALGTSSLFTGTVEYAEIKDGIGGTTVAKFDARAPMGPRYTDPQGNVWTINGSAWSWSRA